MVALRNCNEKEPYISQYNIFFATCFFLTLGYLSATKETVKLVENYFPSIVKRVLQ